MFAEEEKQEGYSMKAPLHFACQLHALRGGGQITRKGGEALRFSSRWKANRSRNKCLYVGQG